MTADRPPAHLSEEDKRLRRGLRAKVRQLGDEGDQLDLLVAECAYEQWHRLLFARFLAENNLLIHPEYQAPVTLEDCEELAASLDEPDGWAVAGRFAAEIVPGIFRLDDPCVRLRLAPEGRLALEEVVASLPGEVFVADDALGWVYQYWQKEQKDAVNRSERKIGGADLGPVTQLFTEHYMVQFLLQNTLGSWWSARHPESKLLQHWDYLLRGDRAQVPLLGSFDGWPTEISRLTVMDPCCGSGHFLVEAFDMLWRMRSEEEQLSPTEAQDLVLRDNLFGLELDPRCVQIAMFALALQAWKAGEGWRRLPTPNIACSGLPAKTPVREWIDLADGEWAVESALARLHAMFNNADTLGSLIDPRHALRSMQDRLNSAFDDVEWEAVRGLLEQALAGEASDPAAAVLEADARGMTRAADFLAQQYCLVATNVPYLTRVHQGRVLAEHLAELFPLSSSDLATAFHERCISLAGRGGIVANVTPQNWLYLGWYEKLRRDLLQTVTWRVVARLGKGAFDSISGEVVNVCLNVVESSRPMTASTIVSIDAQDGRGSADKSHALRSNRPGVLLQAQVLANPDARFMASGTSTAPLLEEFADSTQGICTGDYSRFGRLFWELDVPEKTGWELQQSTVGETQPWGGREHILLWEGGAGKLRAAVTERLGAGREGAWLRGLDFVGKRGVTISQSGNLKATLFNGQLLDNNAAAIVPRDEALLPALWAFCSSPEYAARVREIDSSLKVTNLTLLKVPFDIERWTSVAASQDDPWAARVVDPTQWLFQGRPEAATEPLQVGVCRLLGYRWPAQHAEDDLEPLRDEDGIVCLPSVRGERMAAERLQELLARAFGGTWSPARSQELLARSGSKKKDLDSWLRDDFFKAHCQVFGNRPFIWQVWDGRRDGFSALVNYHRLDRPTLEKLAYSYVGDWIERQAAGVREDVAGAEGRLVAARTLQQRLELILQGDPPYDIYVRWRPLVAQPVGWDPDLDDGVRLNIRPFVAAGVLRSKFNVKWEKDRGQNPDGSERLNDLHLTSAQKLAARGGAA